MDQPTLTPPELRRKKAEVDGRLKGLNDSQSRLMIDLAADGVAHDDERFKTADGHTAEILKLERVSGELATLITRSERWSAVNDLTDTTAPGSLVSAGSQPLPHNDRTNVGTRHEYRLMKVMRHSMDPHKYKLDGLEAEVHVEMDKRRIASDVRKSRGVNVPWDLPVNTEVSRSFARRYNLRYDPLKYGTDGAQLRALDTVAGAGSIPTIIDTTIIELLRARMVTRAMGARMMTDMQGLFAIPRQSGPSTFFMVTQGGAIQASNPLIDQVPFSPHTGGVYTTYTRQFLEQTNQDSEMFVRDDQAQVVARGVETQMLNGQGAFGYPMGIMQNPQIGTLSLGTNGGAPTWGNLVNMESAIAAFNADVGSMGYVMDAVTRGTLKTTVKIAASTFPIYLWNTESPDYPVNGYPVGVTNLLPSSLSKGNATGLHGIIFGNWEDAFYAFWSGMDVIIDPFTSAAQGAVNIVTLQDFDVNVRHFQSFINEPDVVINQTVPNT